MTVALRRAWRVPPLLIVAGLALAWLVLAPRTPDLAAAVYRTLLFHLHGLQLYDDSWFGGHNLPGYSLTFPAVANLIGVRPTGVLAACCSTLLFERLVVARWGRAVRPVALLFALGAVADLMIGRLTFSLGVSVALLALLLLQRGRPVPACLAAALCAVTSPVAGLFLALAALAVWLAQRSNRAALSLALTALLTVAAFALVFPEGGFQPCAIWTLLSVVGFSLSLAVVAGNREPHIRIGCYLYAAAGVASFVLPTAMGSNISRLGPEVAPALLAAMLARPDGSLRLDRPRLVLLLAALVGWQWFAPVREVSKTHGDPSFSATYYQPLLAALANQGPVDGRIEIPFTRAHWEAVYVARRYPLARGWETQLDEKYDHLFFEPRLSATRYRAWLAANSVAYVALPDVPLDPSGRNEAWLLRYAPPGYLRLVWSNAHWRLWRVMGTTPLASGAGRLVSLRSSGFTLRAVQPGATLVRLRFTPYWSIKGPGCVQSDPGGWTRVIASSPGVIVVQASFSLSGLSNPQRVCASAG